MRIPRFTMLQLLLGAGLCGLVLGLLTSSWRAATYSAITAIAYSPDGKTLAARYSGGGFQAWNVAGRTPRLSTQTKAGGWWQSDYGAPVRFADNQTLLDVKVDPSGPGVLELQAIDLSTSRVRPVLSLPMNIFWGLPYAAGGNRVAIGNQSRGTIDCYDLASGKLLCSVKGMAYSQYGLDVTPDGRRLVFLDQTNGVQAVDLDTGQPLITTTFPSVQVAELSRDGRLLAVGDWSSSLVQVHDLAAGTTRTISPELNTAQWLAFSADSKELAIASMDAVEVYDLSTGRRLGRVVLEDRTRPLAILGSKAMFFGWQRQALSPDGRTLASFDGGQVHLWDVKSGRIRHTITGGLRNLQIAIFTIGFALWSAAWGVVARRERLKRPSPPLSLAAYAPTVPGPRPPPKVVSWQRQLGQLLLWLTLVVFFVYFLANWDAVMAAGPRALAPAIVWLVAIAVGLVALLFLYTWVMARLRGPAYWQIAHLRQLTSDRGRTHKHGQITAWFVGVSSIESVFVRECETTAKRLSEILNEPVGFDRPFTILGLDRQCDMDALFKMHVPAAGIVAKNRRPPTVVVCEETAIRRVQSPVLQLRAALVLALVTELRGDFLPPLATAVISFLATQDEETPHILRAAIRRLKVQIERDPAWSPLPLITIAIDELVQLRLKADQPTEARQSQLVLDVCITLAEFLLGPGAPAQRREKALAWLRAARPGDDAPGTLEKSLDQPLVELASQWREWLLAQDVARHDPPPAGKLACLRQYVLLPILDGRLPLSERSRAIRNMAQAGYATGAFVLISLLGDSNWLNKGEVVAALEDLSGQTLGDDPAAWNAWWESLPSAVRQPEEAALIVPAVVANGPIASEPVGSEAAVVTATIVTETRPAVPGLPLPRPAPHAGAAAPVELRVCWGMMIAGGFVAILIPISVLFQSGPLVWPALYYGLVVGCLAIAKGASRDADGLPGVAAFQIANIIACDPVNFILGIIEQRLLKRPHVAQYLLDVRRA